MNHTSFQKFYGILLSTAISIPAYYLGQHFKLIGGSIFAITFGMMIASFQIPNSFHAGIQYSSKKILQYAIILIGFGLNLTTILSVGKQSILIMLSTVSSSLLTAYFIGKLLKIERNTKILIGVGTSICGGSAIAATAPVIDADDQEITYSISTIFLFNIIAVFIFPSIGKLLGLSNTGFGMWAGTAINDTSSVIAAGYTFSNTAGNYATIVKLTRTLLIIPITLILALVQSKKGKASNKSGSYRLSKIFPWFVIGFLFTAILNSIGILPSSLTLSLNNVGKFGIIIAMAAIGLHTNFKKMISNGVRPILLGLSCWFVIAVVSLLVQKIIGFI